MARLIRASVVDELEMFPGGPVPKSMIYTNPAESDCYFNVDENGAVTRRCSRTDKQLSFATPTDDAFEFDTTRRTSKLYRGDKLARFASTDPGVGAAPDPGPGPAGWYLNVWHGLGAGKTIFTRLAGRQYVPPHAPITTTPTHLYYFNGLSNPGHIIQPVLHWEGKNRRYIAANYFISISNPKVKSVDVPVSPGTWLYPVVTGRISSVYGHVYKCWFATSFNGNTPRVPAIEIKMSNTYGFSVFSMAHLGVFEVYNAVSCYDLGYPFVFKDTLLTDNLGYAGTWTGTIKQTGCGQTLQITTNTNPGGRADFRPTDRFGTTAPPIVYPLPV